MLSLRIIDIVDIAIVAGLVYYIYRMARGTNVMIIFWALLIVLIASWGANAAGMRLLGALLNARGVYFVPMAQDDPDGTPTSVIADFSRIRETVEAALAGRQVQPVLLSPSQKNA